MIEKIEDLVGLTVTDIIKVYQEEPADKLRDILQINFRLADGRRCKMYHDQECREDVYVESITGNLDDLIDTPILVAECRQQEKQADPNADEDEFRVWTFYTLATVKGYVDIRWFGSHNGFYSAAVEFIEGE